MKRKPEVCTSQNYNQIKLTRHDDDESEEQEEVDCDDKWLVAQVD